MAQYEDLIAKLILQVALEDHGRVQPEMEIPFLDAQGADLYPTMAGGTPLRPSVWSTE